MSWPNLPRRSQSGRRFPGWRIWPGTPAPGPSRFRLDTPRHGGRAGYADRNLVPTEDGPVVGPQRAQREAAGGVRRSRSRTAVLGMERHDDVRQRPLLIGYRAARGHNRRLARPSATRREQAGCQDRQATGLSRDACHSLFSSFLCNHPPRVPRRKLRACHSILGFCWGGMVWRPDKAWGDSIGGGRQLCFFERSKSGPGLRRRRAADHSIGFQSSSFSIRL